MIFKAIWGFLKLIILLLVGFIAGVLFGDKLIEFFINGLEGLI